MNEQPQGQAPVDNAMKMMQGEEVAPELQEKMDAYTTALMHIVHSDKTHNGVVEMLKSAPPEKSIPFAAIEVNKLVEQSLGSKGKKVDDSVKMAGALYLTADLMELGNATKAWETPVKEDQFTQLFQETLQSYVHGGLKDGSIDPVELQAQTEPILNEQQRQAGTTVASSMQLPDSPTAEMGMDKVIGDRTKPLEQENKKLKGLLSQQPQGGGPNGV